MLDYNIDVESTVDELHFVFGIGSAIHEIVEGMDPRNSCLPVFHVLTGCDTVCWKRKEESGKIFPGVTKAFECLIL